MSDVAEECKEREADDKKAFSAKTISKFFKFASAAGLVTCAVLKWLGIMPNAGVGELCTIWAVVYGLGAGTIDLNIMFDKFAGSR